MCHGVNEPTGLSPEREGEIRARLAAEEADGWRLDLGEVPGYLTALRADRHALLAALTAERARGDALAGANRRFVEALLVEKQRASYRGPGDSAMLSVTNALERLEAALAARGAEGGGVATLRRTMLAGLADLVSLPDVRPRDRALRTRDWLDREAVVAIVCRMRGALDAAACAARGAQS